jgi:hypothetical protein
MLLAALPGVLTAGQRARLYAALMDTYRPQGSQLLVNPTGLSRA